ncbi:uncharacterized protein JCM6883_001052 [Sporobolomyces salmoneus]|uniref:uncharacterized protein n=1 Tax=Sporobolomyces salmoneus TaxID=183962 RepID=UPI003171F546
MAPTKKKVDDAAQLELHYKFQDPTLSRTDAVILVDQYNLRDGNGVRVPESMRGFIINGYGYEVEKEEIHGAAPFAQLLMEHHQPERAKTMYSSLYNLTPRAPRGAKATARRMDNVVAARRNQTTLVSSTSDSAGATLSFAFPPNPIVPPPPPPPPVPASVADHEMEDEEAEPKTSGIELDRMRREDNWRIRKMAAELVAERISKKVAEEMELDESTSSRLQTAVTSVCLYIVRSEIDVPESELLAAFLHRTLHAPTAPLTDLDVQNILSLPLPEILERIAIAYGTYDASHDPTFNPNQATNYIKFTTVLDREIEEKRLAELERLQKDGYDSARQTAMNQIRKILGGKNHYVGLTGWNGRTLDDRHADNPEPMEYYLGFSRRGKQYRSLEDALMDMKKEQEKTEETKEKGKGTVEAGEGEGEASEGSDSREDFKLEEEDDDDDSGGGADFDEEEDEEGEERESVPKRTEADVARMKSFGGGGGRRDAFVHQEGRRHKEGSVKINSIGSIMTTRIRLHFVPQEKVDERSSIVGILEIIETAIWNPPLNTNPAGDFIVPSIDESTRKLIREIGSDASRTIYAAYCPPGKEGSRGQRFVLTKVVNGAGNEHQFSETDTTQWVVLHDVLDKPKKGSDEKNRTAKTSKTVESEFTNRITLEVERLKKEGNGLITLVSTHIKVLEALGLTGSDGSGINREFGREPSFKSFDGSPVLVVNAAQPNGSIYQRRQVMRTANANLLALGTTFSSFASSLRVNYDSPEPVIYEILLSYLEKLRPEFNNCRFQYLKQSSTAVDGATTSFYPSAVYRIELSPIPPSAARPSREISFPLRPKGKILTYGSLKHFGITGKDKVYASWLDGTLDAVLDIKGEGMCIRVKKTSKLHVNEGNLVALGHGQDKIAKIKREVEEIVRNEGILPLLRYNGAIGYWVRPFAKFGGTGQEGFKDVYENPTFPHGSVRGKWDGSVISSLPRDDLGLFESLVQQERQELDKEFAKMNMSG